MTVNAGEKILYIVNGNTTAMAAGIGGTIQSQSRAMRDYHATAWNVTPVTYEADFGTNQNYTPTDAAMRTHCNNVAAILAANPTVSHVICSTQTPGGVFTGKWAGYTVTNQAGEAFDAWFGAAKYMKTGSIGWTTGTEYIGTNDTLIVGPKRYAGCDTNYLPYGRLGHWQFGAQNGGTSTVELTYESPAITRRIIQDALASVGSDAIHKNKNLYCGWGGSVCPEPSLGANEVYNNMVLRRGYTRQFVFQAAGGTGQPVPCPPNTACQNLYQVPAASFGNSGNSNIWGPSGTSTENAGWVSQLTNNKIWLFLDPYIPSNWGNGGGPNAVMAATFQGNIAQGGWYVNQSSAGGVGCAGFLAYGGCLAQGTVSEPSSSGIISYQYLIQEFLNARTWAEACLAAMVRGTAVYNTGPNFNLVQPGIGKMGVYGDPLAQHFKLNTATWL
jgi:hypothetical protein